MNALKFLGKKSALPPLGLLTVAAMLPEEWNKRLTDMNITHLHHRDIRWAIARLHCDDSGASLAAAIAAGTAIAVCDGSYKDSHGTAAFVIEGTTSAHRFLGVNVTPGFPEDQSPYRAELGGIIGVVVAIRCICKFHNVTAGSILLYCDCDNALKRLFRRHSSLKPKIPHYDLLSFLDREIESSPLAWSCEHVRGHQDKHGFLLNRQEHLNVEMDNLAKSYWIHTSGYHGSPQQRVHGEAWPLWIESKKITGQFAPAIHDHIGGKRIREHWASTHRFPLDTIHTVDWDACEVAMKSLKITRRIWVSKHTSGFCGVGKMMKLWNEWDNDKCPRCGVSPEDAQHVWICPSPQANDIWEESLVTLKAWLLSVDTIPGVADLIVDRLREWRTSEYAPDNPIDHTFPGVAAAFAAQDAIGWNRFLEGCIALEWQSTQDRYYKWLESRRTGFRWASALIVKLLDVAWDQWEHRNSYVHPRQRIGADQPLPATDDAIRAEWERGRADLPTREHHHFEGTLEERLSSPPTVRRAWLKNVRAARMFQEHNIQHNQTASQAFMHAWLAG